MSDHAPPPHDVKINVSGVTVVTVDGGSVRLTPGERVVVAALLLDRDAGATLSLLEHLRWPDQRPPPTARQSLQNTVSRLRSKTGLPLHHHGGRYRLRRDVSADVDALRLSDTALPRPDVEEGLLSSRRRWFDDLPDTYEVAAERAKLDAALDAAREYRVQQLRADGRPADALALAGHRRRHNPGDESAWATEVELLLSLGRRLDAAALYRRACRDLTALTGMAPGQALHRLERWIWNDEPGISGADNRPLVGRETARRSVMRDLTRVGTVLLAGGCGSGKSRLAEAIRLDWPVGSLLIQGSHSRRAPLATIDQLLRASGDADRCVLDGRILAGLERIVDRCIDVLTETSLLVVDDVDRLAPLTRMILARALSRVDCRALATARSAGSGIPGRADPAVTTLGGLQQGELARLTGLDMAGVRTIVELVGSAPGAVIQLVEQARRAGTPIDQLGLLARARRVPRGISDLLLGRLADQPREVRDLVDVVAVTPAVDAGLLDQTTTTLAVAPGGPLRRTVDDRLEFAHPLIRRVVLDRLPSGLCQEALLLAALEAGDALAPT